MYVPADLARCLVNQFIFSFPSCSCKPKIAEGSLDFETCITHIHSSQDLTMFLSLLMKFKWKSLGGTWGNLKGFVNKGQTG